MGDDFPTFTVSRWPYIHTIPFSGDMKTDVTRLLTVNGKPRTAAHCVSVAHTIQELAVRFGLDPAAAVSAALLHDIAAIIKPADMLAYAIERGWALDSSEHKHPFLLHQRFSSVIAQELFFVKNPAVLSAIACHTTLKPAPSDADMALFLADKLSWDQEGTPPFYDIVSSALNRSLRAASLAYMEYVLARGMVLIPHPWLLEAKAWLDTH